MLEECSPKGGPEPATERRGSTRLETAAGPSDGPGSGRPAMVGPIFKGPTMPREPSPAARACPAKISFFLKGGRPVPPVARPALPKGIGGPREHKGPKARLRPSLTARKAFFIP